MVRFGQRPSKPRLAPDERLQTTHPACRLDPGDPPDGQRARQPETGGEWRPVIEERRHGHHDGQAKMASACDLHVGTQRAADLSGYDSLFVHPPSRPVTKSTIASNQLRLGSAAAASASVSGSTGTTM